MGFTVGVNLAGEGEGLLAIAAGAAKRLERLGFDAIEFAESAHEPFLACVLAAEHSRRIAIHTSVAIAFPRSPMVTAMLAWDLQRYSGGRFVLGLGTQVKGHNERRFSTPWSAPAPRMREYVQSLRAAWRSFQEGVPLEYVGQHYAFSLMPPAFNPGPIAAGGVPIELAAVNVRNAVVAGEVGDGVKLHPFHTGPYMRDVLLPQVAAGRAPAGGSAAFRVRGGGLMATGRTWVEAERSVIDVKRWISFYGSTAAYQAVLRHHGEEELGEHLRALSLEGRWDEMARAVSDDVVEKLAIVAPYDELPGRFARQYRGLVDHVMLNESLLVERDDDALASLVAAFHAA